MDAIARYNLHRWRALAQANALFTRPALDLDPVSGTWDYFTALAPPWLTFRSTYSP